MMRARRTLLLATGACALALPAFSAPARADDLRGALAEAYMTNPTLQAARAQQRATDEGVVIERAAGLPGVSASATYSEFLNANEAGTSPASAVPGFGPDRLLSGSVNLSVPVYSGGGVRNAVRAAETRVDAGQADLRGTESAVFSQVVAAYLDVLLGESVVRLQRNLVKVLETNLQATTDRFEIGDLTRTDVAQSQARLEVAKGNARSAEANLIAARERYIQLVGRAPGMLESPPPLPGLPDSVGEAVSVALEDNPDLDAARERSKAADYDVKAAGASRLPRVSLFATGSHSDYLDSFGVPGLPASSAVSRQNYNQSGSGATAGAQVSIPIFQGGRPGALRRQAQARSSAAIENEIAMERGVIAQVRAAYSSWQAANEIIQSSQSAVDAAALSLEGVRAENTVGNRTILDILNAEQELLNAQVQLVTARRNAYVAGFTLLAAMGHAEAQDLGLDGGALYDPMTNYRRVRGKIFDWDSDPAPVAQSTRTVDTPAQDGSIPTE